MSKVTDAQVGDFLGIMRTNDASVDAKVSCLNDLKASIRHHHLPDSSVAPIFDIVRAAMTSQHAAIMSAGFSTLQHLLKRLALQEPKHLTIHGPRVLPLLADRLGDLKDRPRGQASQCLSDLWKVCPQEVERLIRDSTMVSRNPRTKEQSLRWVAKMSKEHNLPFRGFVSRMVDALEDADGMVRDTAKATVVELFQNAPMHARADLKRQLQQHNVRRSIVNDVLSQLPASEAPPQQPAQTNHAVDAPSKVAFLNEVANGEPHPPSVPSTHSDHDYDQIEPTIVTSPRELDETFRSMHECFEGRESEGNWLQREKSILRLRKLTKGNVLRDYPTVFLAGVKSSLDGILKCVNSLRTTLSTHSCSFVQELAKAAGPGLDPMTELLLQNLIRLCAGTKKISSQMGNTTVDIIFANVSYNVRILQHVWGACQDKNVQPRMYAAGWLETIITKQAHHRHQLEHTGGLDYIEKCIRKGLSDPNPGVRESMRKTFWVFAGSFSDKADLIMSSLDVSSKRSLERHPGNPNSENISSHSAEASVSTKPMFSRSTTVAAPVSRTTLKETIAARKREAAASRGLPSRPESAQSAFSPSLKKVQSSSNMSSSLASAPMRPMRAPRRPEIHRPATADPFSRRMVKASSPGITNTAAAAMVKGKSKQESPATRSIRNRPTRADSSPAQSDSMSSDAGGSRDIRRDEELTMVIPRVNMDRVLLPVLQESEPVSEDQSRSPVKEIPFHPKTPSTTIRRVEPVVEEEEIPLRAANGTAKEESSVNGTGSVDEPAVVPATPELQVYEDPTESNERQTSPARLIRPTVLEERTVNEPLRNGTSPISSRSSPQGLKTPQTSPRKKSVQERTTDTPQGRRLLNNVISQVKAGQTDISRLRRLQSGLEGNTDLWPDTSSFEQLLSSLLDIVASNEPSGITTTDHNDLEKLRIQALVTIRSMFKNSPDRFSSLYPSTLKTLLRARGLYVESSPVVEALAETAERITQSMPSESCIEAILDVLAPSTQEDSSSIPSSATLSLGFDLISTSLERGSSTTSNTASPALPDVLASRLGHLAIRCLDDLDPSLRHSVTTACVGLYERMESHARFWKVMHAVREDQRMLITYHIVRKESQHQRQDQSASSAVVAPVVSATATATLVS